MNQKTNQTSIPPYKMKLTVRGTKNFNKKLNSISTQTTSPDQLLLTHQNNGLQKNEVTHFKLIDKEELVPNREQWSIMKEEGERLAEMGMITHGRLLSSIQGNAPQNLFHQQHDQFLVSIKKWLVPNDQNSLFQEQHSQVCESQNLTVSKSESIRYSSPYSYWFSCDANKIKTNRPLVLGIGLCSKNQ